MAVKYFGNETVLGKSLMLGTNPFKVTGIIEKIPDNSHFHFDAFVSMTSNNYAIHGTTWSNLGFYTYLVLH